jgi:hypothetical protein
MVPVAALIVVLFVSWVLQSAVSFGSLFASFAEVDTTGIQRLSVGQCFNGARPDPHSEAITLVDDAEVVACTTPHEAELVGAFDYPVSASAPYPGTQQVSSYAEAECGIRFASYVGIPFEHTAYGLTYIPPMDYNWAIGDRSVQCLVNPPDGQAFMTGSVRNSRR